MLPKNAVQLTPCANPLSSSWPNFATSAFSQPSPVNYTFFTFLHQHSSTKGENIQHVRSSSCCHLDLIVLIDLQEKVKPNSDGSSPFALKGFGYPSTSNTCETVNQPLLKIVPAASSISLESIRNNFKPLPIMQVLFLSFIRNGAANSTVQGTSGLEYLPCAIGRAHQLALCSSSQPFGSGAFFLAKNLITSVAPSENPQRCLQLAQGNPGFFFRFSCNWDLRCDKGLWSWPSKDPRSQSDAKISPSW